MYDVDIDVLPASANRVEGFNQLDKLFPLYYHFISLEVHYKISDVANIEGFYLISCQMTWVISFSFVGSNNLVRSYIVHCNKD